MEGAQDARIDHYQTLADAAMFNRVATNKQRINPKSDLFDADKVRKSMNQKVVSPEVKKRQHAKAMAALKNWKP
ncbi:hypothetical protein ABC382_08850 [Lysinibacillus sp. 1P01SD]|uniref:hypothetical protein n=1 Tax=Lysinibacillus sp. 1P01SD TaxID=3132285 RepID=UPI0039A0ED42